MDIIIFFKQPLMDVENINRDITGFHMGYD